MKTDIENIVLRDAVTLDGITYSYPNASLPVFENFSLSIAKDEVTAVMGISGCGKSTLGRILGGELVPSAGQIVWDDSLLDKSHRFYMDQDPKKVFFPAQTVLKNVIYPGDLLGKSEDSRSTLAKGILEDFGLEQHATSFPLRLSGGQQSRLALARVFAWAPPFIVFDECLASLDVNTKNIMIDAMVRHAETTTSVVITHSLNEALMLADRCVVLRGLPAEVVADFKLDMPRPRDPGSAIYIENRATFLSQLQNEL